MEVGSKRKITLQYKGKNYQGYVELRETIGIRSRLFWFSEFSTLIRNHFPESYQTYTARAAIKNEPPVMRLKRLNESKTLFSVEFVLPYEIRLDVESEPESEQPPRPEGGVCYFYSKQYERDAENRRRAIEIHGTVCCICKFDFELHYGSRGMGFIEIHHTKPLSSLSAKIVVDPHNDLVPVCSNCHRMIHRRKDDVLSIAQMENIWQKENS